MQTNTETNTSKSRGRQVGQRVQSLDFRAYKALRDFDFAPYAVHADSHGRIDDHVKDDMIEALINRLREKDIF